MTRKELNLAVFERTADRPLWQPRLETWIDHHVWKGTMPEPYKGLDNLGIYDKLRASIRYEASVGLESSDGDDVIRTNRVEGEPRSTTEALTTEHRYETVTTPVGSITWVHREIYQDGRCVNGRVESYPVKDDKDLRVAAYIMEHRKIWANIDAFNAAATRVGDRAEPTTYFTSAGFTTLVKDWCGLENTFYILADYQDAVEEFLAACDRYDDRAVDAVLQLPFKIINFGDHATNEFTPPPILEKYMMPRWQRLSARLHEHGRFVHSHWDGHSALMLPYLKDTGLDAVEALTPKPMGDMTLEMIKEAVGDQLVCLDLIPAIHFLDQYKTEEVLDFTKRILDMFAPNLILGISDEISQVGQIEKVEAISELLENTCGLAD